MKHDDDNDDDPPKNNNNSDNSHVLNVYYMLGTVLRDLCAYSHFSQLTEINIIYIFIMRN